MSLCITPALIVCSSLTSAIYCALFMNYFEDLVDLTKYTRVGVLCLFEVCFS